MEDDDGCAGPGGNADCCAYGHEFDCLVPGNKKGAPCPADCSHSTSRGIAKMKLPTLFFIMICTGPGEFRNYDFPYPSQVSNCKVMKGHTLLEGRTKWELFQGPMN